MCLLIKRCGWVGEGVCLSSGSGTCFEIKFLKGGIRKIYFNHFLTLWFKWGVRIEVFKFILT